MSQNVKYALIIIALSVIILVVNRGEVSVDLIITKVKVMGSFAYLGFISLGVIIGMLLK